MIDEDDMSNAITPEVRRLTTNDARCNFASFGRNLKTNPKLTGQRFSDMRFSNRCKKIIFLPQIYLTGETTL